VPSGSTTAPVGVVLAKLPHDASITGNTTPASPRYSSLLACCFRFQRRTSVTESRMVLPAGVGETCGEHPSKIIDVRVANPTFCFVRPAAQTSLDAPR